jgi:hypothetical protein
MMPPYRSRKPSITAICAFTPRHPRRDALVNRAVWCALAFACAFGGVDGARDVAVCSAGPDAAAVAAPAETVRELQAALGEAVRRFETQDAAGVLARVSDQYRTGPFTKAGLREQLVALYALYDTVRARVRIDRVEMVGAQAWIYSTGEVSGRLRLLGSWAVILSWQQELEVARREAGEWRLFGYQQ